MVQLDYDEELGPFHGMYGSMEAELEVQRTIKRAELTAFLCLLKKVMDPSRCMSTTKELLTVFGEEKENVIPKLAMLICESRFGKRYTFQCQKKYWWKWSMHVKAHRTKKDKKEMKQFEKFVADDNEKTDE